MSPKPSLSIVLPCYNEEIRIPIFEKSLNEFLKSFSEELQKRFSSIEFVFVDDGSKDRTLELLNSLAAMIANNHNLALPLTARVEKQNPNAGKGAAVARGMIASKGDLILMSDIDLSSPLREVFSLHDQSVDFAFGSRALEASKVTIQQNGLRPMLGRLFNLYMRIVTGLPFQDTQCGFKLIRGDLAREIAPQMHERRFAFDIEMLLLANRPGISFKEVPVEWAHQEPSRVSPLRDGLRMGWKVIEFRLRYPRWRSLSNQAADSADL